MAKTDVTAKTAQRLLFAMSGRTGSMNAQDGNSGSHPKTTAAAGHLRRLLELQNKSRFFELRKRARDLPHHDARRIISFDEVVQLTSQS
jgi:hypothetical protein